MTKDEALALALKALKKHDGNYAQSNASAARVNAAITAIKQAQAPVEPVGTCDSCQQMTHKGVPHVCKTAPKQ